MHDPGKPQLWILVGGNGAGKTTFYHQFLEPHGFPFVNADIIAHEYFPEDTEGNSLKAAQIAEQLRYQFLEKSLDFCFETVFSHPGKIDFLGDAVAHGYEIIFVLIHLNDKSLNIARVAHRVGNGGHSVPEEKIGPRIDRLESNVRQLIKLGLANQVHVFDNSDYDNPYARVFSIVKGDITEYQSPLPAWARALTAGA